MTRRGARRATRALRATPTADAGSTTGVATVVLALVSAGALATLGLVSASELSGGLGDGLHLGGSRGDVRSPGRVVVAQDDSGERGGSGSGPRRERSGRGGGEVTAPVESGAVVGPASLPQPAGAGVLPPAPLPLPAAVPPAPEPTAAPAASAPPTSDPTIRTATQRGRSASAPGHTKDRSRGSSGGRGIVLMAVPGPRDRTDDRTGPPAVETFAGIARRGRSAEAPGHTRPAPGAPVPSPVVPSPVPTPVLGLVVEAPGHSADAPGQVAKAAG